MYIENRKFELYSTDEIYIDYKIFLYIIYFTYRSVLIKNIINIHMSFLP